MTGITDSPLILDQIISVSVIILSECSDSECASQSLIGLVVSIVQGWSSVFPKFSAVDFVSLYLECDLCLPPHSLCL